MKGRCNLAIGFGLALMALMLTACSPSADEAEPQAAPAPAAPAEDWPAIRCGLMQGFALLATRDLRVWHERAGNAVALDEIRVDEAAFDRMLAAFERLSEEAFILWAVTKDETPALCLYGGDLAAIEVPFRILVNTLVDRVACAPPAPASPWGRRLERLRKLANEPQTRLFLDSRNGLEMALTEARIQRCETPEEGRDGV